MKGLKETKMIVVSECMMKAVRVMALGAKVGGMSLRTFSAKGDQRYS